MSATGSQAVLFPGQGAQFVGMSANLIERCPGTQEMFEAATRVLGQDLWTLTTEGPEEALDSTAVSQPAIFVVSLAVVRALEAISAVDGRGGCAGLSLGEYSALVYAGSLEFEDALEIVVRRGQFMQEACERYPSGMTSILGLDLPTVREVVAVAGDAGVISIANVNARLQIVVSGEHAALERAAEIAQERGARRVIPLKVAGAYHSPLMAGATAQLRPYLDRLKIAPPQIPFFANVSAESVSDPNVIRDGLIRQIESPVLWAPILESLIESGIESVLEPGPGRVIAGLVKQIDRRLPVHSVLDEDSFKSFLNGEK